jgi:hypothetical protein
MPHSNDNNTSKTHSGEILMGYERGAHRFANTRGVVLRMMTMVMVAADSFLTLYNIT